MNIENKLDVIYALDTTASMGSWIERSKKTIGYISKCFSNQNVDARFNIIGYKDREIKIFPDPKLLNKFDISVSELNAIITHENVKIGGGKLISKTKEFILKTKADALSVEELKNIKIKATVDSDFTNPTSCDIIISADNHSRTLDLKESKWRKSTTYYSQFKGQDLMESRRQIKRRGTFIEFNIVSASKYKLEFDSFEIEYGGVRK
jgi:hypothetical protein